MFRIKSFRFYLLAYLLIIGAVFNSISAANTRANILINLDAVVVNDPSLKLLTVADDLNQDYNNITNFPGIRLVIRGKKKNLSAKYSIYDVSSGSRTFISLFNSNKNKNTLYLGSFDGITNKEIEIDIELNGLLNTYKASIAMSNSPSTDAGTSANEGSDADLYNKCFNVNDLNNYPDCVELFFRKVTFQSNDETAAVVNDNGSFVVTIPSTAGAAGPAGSAGPAGPQGPRGFAGDTIWSTLGNSITNNGASGGYNYDLVFGDSLINNNGENKLSFEKATNALRIGSTANGEWSVRGIDSVVIGKNSSATANGSMSIGHENVNPVKDSFIYGIKNILGVETSYSHPSVGTVFKGRKNYIIGEGNTANGGTNTLVGLFNKTLSRTSNIFGNSNSVGDITQNSYSSETKSIGTAMFISGSSNRVRESSLGSSGNFISGSYNYMGAGNEIHGSSNYISSYSAGSATVHGSKNHIWASIQDNVYGSRNDIDGSYQTTTGTTGTYVRTTSRANLILGDRNSLINARYNVIVGTRNYSRCNYLTTGECLGSSVIMGRSNYTGSYTEGAPTIQNAIMYGLGNRVTDNDGVAMGRFATSEAVNAMVFGTGLSYYNQLVNDTEDTLAIGFDATEPTIYLTSPKYPDSDGYVGIGLNNPQRKLHISEAMRIEPQEYAPDYASLGDIYVDASEAVCVYASDRWNKIAGDGECKVVLRYQAQNPTHTNLIFDLNPVLRLWYSAAPLNLGSGKNLVIKKLSDDSVVDTIPSNSMNINFTSGNVIDISLNTSLESGVTYYIDVDEAYVSDTQGGVSPEIDGKTSWTFTTN